MYLGTCPCPAMDIQDGGVEGCVELTGKFNPGVQNEAGQSLTEFQKENMLFIADILFQQPKR